MTRRLAVQEPSALCEGFDDLLAVHGNPLVEIGDRAAATPSEALWSAAELVGDASAVEPHVLSADLAVAEVKDVQHPEVDRPPASLDPEERPGYGGVDNVLDDREVLAEPLAHLVHSVDLQVADEVLIELLCRVRPGKHAHGGTHHVVLHIGRVDGDRPGGVARGLSIEVLLDERGHLGMCWHGFPLMRWTSHMRQQYRDGVTTASQEQETGRIEQRRRTRRRLLSAAGELLRAQEPVTVEAAALRAGVSRATAYRYFGTADVLRLEAALTEVLDSGPVAEIREVCERVADHTDRVEAVVRCMAGWAWDTQPSLRVALRQALEGRYRRPGNRESWIALALAPALPELGPAAAEQLRRALYPLFGIDPLLSLGDLLELNREQALETLAFTARALVDQALARSRG